MNNYYFTFSGASNNNPFVFSRDGHLLNLCWVRVVARNSDIALNVFARYFLDKELQEDECYGHLFEEDCFDQTGYPGGEYAVLEPEKSFTDFKNLNLN